MAIIKTKKTATAKAYIAVSHCQIIVLASFASSRDNEARIFRQKR